MEKFITATGKTIDLAIEAALRELKMDRDSVSVEVLENPKSGFLGFGASPAKVKVTYEVPDEPERPAPALSSASRSKSKKAEPAPASKAINPKPINPPKKAEAAPKAAEKPAEKPAEKRERAPKAPKVEKTYAPAAPAPRRRRSKPLSRGFWSTWAPMPCPTPTWARTTPTRWIWWARIWAF